MRRRRDAPHPESGELTKRRDRFLHRARAIVHGGHKVVVQIDQRRCLGRSRAAAIGPALRTHETGGGCTPALRASAVQRGPNRLARLLEGLSHPLVTPHPTLRQVRPSSAGRTGGRGCHSDELAGMHALANPVVSHDGEEVLNQLMHECGSGFEHNLHALRIIEDFEEKYASFRGLNLTFEVREGVVKHSRDYGREDTTYVDISEYRKGERPPLEAQLIDLTDEIAYNSADLDDGYDSGLLSVDQICQHVNLFRELYQEVESAYSDAAEGIRVSETVRRLIDVLATSLIRETRSLIESNQIESVEAVRAFPGRLARFEAEVAANNQQLKQFLRAHLYTHPALRKAREEARSLIERLFRHYEDYPQRLPEGHYSRIGTLGIHRVVCDYIAGMTDPYARSRYAASSKHTIA